MSRLSRRKLIKAAGAAGIVGLAGCSGDGGGTETDTDGGSAGGGTTETTSSGSDTRTIGITQHDVGGTWITAFFESGKLYAESQGIEYETFLHDESAEEQITQIRQMVNQDYDGIVAVPWNEAVNSALKEADEAGVPVFSTNADIASEHIKTFTAFGNYNAGAKCGEGMITALEEQRGDQDTWDVLNIRGAYNYTSNQRTDGFVETVEQNDKVNIIDTIETDWSRSNAQEKTAEWINANDAPDGVYASNMTSGLGVYAALDREGLVHPKDNDQHIVHTQLDGGPEVNPKVSDGVIDLAVDQPNYFYIPLAIKQMQQYWENGEEALPDPGSQLTKDDITIEPIEHKGVDLWSEPIWSPAEVSENNEHIQVQTAGVTITQDNADAPYHWGNIWG